MTAPTTAHTIIVLAPTQPSQETIQPTTPTGTNHRSRTHAQFCGKVTVHRVQRPRGARWGNGFWQRTPPPGPHRARPARPRHDAAPPPGAITSTYRPTAHGWHSPWDTGARIGGERGHGHRLERGQSPEGERETLPIPLFDPRCGDSCDDKCCDTMLSGVTGFWHIKVS